MGTKRSPSADADTRNVKLVLTYDGAGFVGWQRQKNAPSVQQALEEAIARVTGEQPTVVGAGRTDAGVHALGQVANFHTASRLSVVELHRALNGVLPATVAVLEAEEVDPAFHSRYRATGKHYRYTIYNATVRPVLERHRVLHVPRRLDLSRVRRAARVLVGEHDFAAFTTHAREKENTVRRVEELNVRRNGERVLVDIIGNGFLYNMVRAIVGTLLDVGRGRLSAEDVADILTSADRRRAGNTAPAHGLCLVSVRYPDEDGQRPPSHGARPRAYS